MPKILTQTSTILPNPNHIAEGGKGDPYLVSETILVPPPASTWSSQSPRLNHHHAWNTNICSNTRRGGIYISTSTTATRVGGEPLKDAPNGNLMSMASAHQRLERSAIRVHANRVTIMPAPNQTIEEKNITGSITGL